MMADEAPISPVVLDEQDAERLRERRQHYMDYMMKEPTEYIKRKLIEGGLYYKLLNYTPELRDIMRHVIADRERRELLAIEEEKMREKVFAEEREKRLADERRRLEEEKERLAEYERVKKEKEIVIKYEEERNARYNKFIRCHEYYRDKVYFLQKSESLKNRTLKIEDYNYVYFWPLGCKEDSDRDDCLKLYTNTMDKSVLMELFDFPIITEGFLVRLLGERAAKSKIVLLNEIVRNHCKRNDIYTFDKTIVKIHWGTDLESENYIIQFDRVVCSKYFFT
jgi:hypothetical protein